MMTNFLAIAFSIICTVESANGKYMVNKQDPSCAGWTGMRPIAVEDCNRILGSRVFTTQDRFSKPKSWLMFRVLVNHYLPGTSDMDAVARLWCRGHSRMYAPETAMVTEYLIRVAEEHEHAERCGTGTGDHF